MLNNIFANAEEKYVKSTVLYANENKNLFADAEFKQAIDGETLMRLFLINAALICDSNGAYHRPITCAESGEGSIIAVLIDGTAVQYGSKEVEIQ